ncbi:hypothetical protein BCV69DRAFT_301116 [Microstroma glucosiphilum]|uniref:Uncharacterized protein n=1 Tax=Pseudomicrostroma glucosiphilum TaxID=1684307 RepID=A0A316U6P6_9BASI|nr:hypothetical protein BCV69DRAFT_301116 [Pseudomicrostroma glucosiphilum]PWN18635.1 hypothetical protein BCV69DRAFT_301116 [Pseudomicrostroma glucosiphilum]
MATATTLGRPAEQSSLSYHHLRRPSSSSGSRQAYSAEQPSYSSAATATTAAAMEHPSRPSPPLLAGPSLPASASRLQGRQQQVDVGSRGIKRSAEAAEADEGRRDDYPGYSTYSRGSSRSTALPSASLSSYSAMPPMRTQLPSFDSFSSSGVKGSSDDFLPKRPRDSYTMDSAARSSSFHSPRTIAALDVNQADQDRQTHHYYHNHQQRTLPPRGSSLLPRARNHDDVQPDAPSHRDASPHQPSPPREHPDSSSTSHPGQQYPHSQQESQYQRQRQHYDSMHAPDEAAYSVTSSSSFDGSSMPLAMRRGDAAHAKASKLHIDVPTTAAAPTTAPTAVYEYHRGTTGSRASAPRASELPSHASLPQLSQQRASDAGPVSRSAPPTRVAFLDRSEGAGGPIDPRGEGSRASESRYSRHPHHHHQQQQHRQQPNYSPHARSNASDLPGSADSNDGAVAAAGPASPRLQSPSGVEARTYGSASAGGASHTAYQHASASRGPALTPISSRFAPHTATLPSPAYHTARLVGGGSVGANDHSSHGRPSASGAAAAAAPGIDTVPVSSSSTSPSPITHALASKAQFLSLFSSFYDSLSDSRTLKLTLEDQVRRSNALLQTLQKSTRVLEATVERKLAEERAGWEVRVGRLEEEVKSLTAKLAGEQVLEMEDGADQEDEAEETARVRQESETAQSLEEEVVQKRSPSSASAASGSRAPSVAVAVTTEKVES